MTKQSKTVMKRGFMSNIESLVQKSILSLFMAIALTFTGVNAVHAKTDFRPVVEVAAKLNQTSAVATLNTAVPGGNAVLDMNTAFIASYPEVDVSAILDATGSQVTVILVNGPDIGTHTVGRINVFDASDNLHASGLVTLKDGILEVDLSDI